MFSTILAKSIYIFAVFSENGEGWKMRFVHCREKKKLRVSSENPIWRQKGRSGRISEPRRRISLWKSNFWCSGGAEQDRGRFEVDTRRMHICKISKKIIIWKVKTATSEEIKPGLKGRVEIRDLFSPLSEKNFPLCGADYGRRMEGDEYLMLFSPGRLQMFLRRGVAVSLFQIVFQWTLCCFGWDFSFVFLRPFNMVPNIDAEQLTF